jgi:hypothetical protein
VTKTGTTSYLVTPEHTAKARSTLGPDRWLLPEQAIVLETNPDQARAIARRHISRYLDLPNHTNNWRRLGFTDDDLVGQASDRLVDALVAWGDVEAVSGRVKDHLDAGADYICIQVLTRSPMAYGNGGRWPWPCCSSAVNPLQPGHLPAVRGGHPRLPRRAAELNDPGRHGDPVPSGAVAECGWSTSEASPQTAAVRCAKVRSASRPAGHSESKVL